MLLGDGAFSELCELANGTVITPRDLVPWLGAAELETILFDGPSTVLSVSRRRSFTGAIRRAIEVRDRHCQHPAGCDIPADQCDIDHIVPYTHGGLTSQFNGRLECPTHNRHHDCHDHGATAPQPARHAPRRTTGPPTVAIPPRGPRPPRAGCTPRQDAAVTTNQRRRAQRSDPPPASSPRTASPSI